jgi:hypothetical protein
MRKATKSDVDYSLGMKERHCGKAYPDDENFCRYFIPPLSRSANHLGTCEKVEGPISPVFWCRLFARARAK